MTVRGLLVTGTDTGVGKTVVAAGLVAWLHAQDRPVRPLKPVESGTGAGGVPSDAALLARCAGLAAPGDANVFALSEPLAPVVAARRAGVELSMGPIDQRIEALRGEGGVLIVEGVGGALVEVVPGIMAADLATRWDLAVVVVAANRLGVLSHTLLTVEALRHRGATVAGVVLNQLLPAEGPAEETNADELRRLLPADVPLLGTVAPVSPEACDDPEALARAVACVAERLFGARK